MARVWLTHPPPRAWGSAQARQAVRKSLPRAAQEEEIMDKKNDNDTTVPLIRLKYKNGDLIIKEGDYGISIYRIIDGKVAITKESEGKDIFLADLGPGDIFGEMTFLGRTKEARNASARACEDSIVEVWHPTKLMDEYAKMPPIIKFMTDQTLSRLIRMNKLIIELTTREQKKREEMRKEDPLNSRRRYFRKKVDLECNYRPARSSDKVRLSGRAINLGLGGIGIEIPVRNAEMYSHVKGDLLKIQIVLPDRKNLEIECRIEEITRNAGTEKILVGMSISAISPGSRKLLGFFLMP